MTTGLFAPLMAVAGPTVMEPLIAGGSSAWPAPAEWTAQAARPPAPTTTPQTTAGRPRDGTNADFAWRNMVTATGPAGRATGAAGAAFDLRSEFRLGLRAATRNTDASAGISTLLGTGGGGGPLGFGGRLRYRRDTGRALLTFDARARQDAWSALDPLVFSRPGAAALAGAGGGGAGMAAGWRRQWRMRAALIGGRGAPLGYALTVSSRGTGYGGGIAATSLRDSLADRAITHGGVALRYTLGGGRLVRLRVAQTLYRAGGTRPGRESHVGWSLAYATPLGPSSDLALTLGRAIQHGSGGAAIRDRRALTFRAAFAQRFPSGTARFELRRWMGRDGPWSGLGVEGHRSRAGTEALIRLALLRGPGGGLVPTGRLRLRRQLGRDAITADIRRGLDPDAVLADAIVTRVTLSYQRFLTRRDRLDLDAGFGRVSDAGSGLVAGSEWARLRARIRHRFNHRWSLSGGVAILRAWSRQGGGSRNARIFVALDFATGGAGRESGW